MNERGSEPWRDGQIWRLAWFDPQNCEGSARLCTGWPIHSPTRMFLLSARLPSRALGLVDGGLLPPLGVRSWAVVEPEGVRGACKLELIARWEDGPACVAGETGDGEEGMPEGRRLELADGGDEKAVTIDSEAWVRVPFRTSPCLLFILPLPRWVRQPCSADVG